MSEIPRLSAKEAIILRMLFGDTKPLYGLEMVQMSEGKLKPGTIYVTLSRMEDKGYLESEVEKKDPGLRGLPRRIYKPSGLGERAYKFWEEAQAQWNGVAV